MATKKDPRLTSRVFSFSAILIFVQTGNRAFFPFFAHIKSDEFFSPLKIEQKTALFALRVIVLLLGCLLFVLSA